MTPTQRLTAALAVGGTVAAALAALVTPASATSVPVTLANGSSSRTLHLSAADGSTLDATNGLAIGPGKTASITASVTDAEYSQTGYQVSSTMTNLYQPSGSSYNFSGPSVPSSDVTLVSPTSPLDLSALAGKVQPVFTLTGNLTSVLTPILAGLPVGTLPVGVNLASMSESVTGAPQDVSTAVGHILSGASPLLPLVTTGPSAGAFTTPASIGSGDPNSGVGATSRLIISGAPGGTGYVNTLTAGILSTLNSSLGGMTGTALATAGDIDSASVLAAVSATTNIPVSSLSPSTASIMSALTGTVSSLLGGLLGQSGLYAGNATLAVSVPAGLAGGTYKGILTVTLADVP